MRTQEYTSLRTLLHAQLMQHKKGVEQYEAAIAWLDKLAGVTKIKTKPVSPKQMEELRARFALIMKNS